MDPDSGATSDYRRGSVFGLTVAEIFILMLFLLLILLAKFEEDAAQERERTRADLADAKAKLQELEPWQALIGEFETPDEVVTLRRTRDDAVRAAERHKREADTLRAVVDGEETLQEAINRASAAQREAEERAAEAERQAQARVAAAESEAANAREDLRVLRTKGQKPPCWYRVVPDGKGGVRERAEYAFNIGVFADHFVLRRAATPSGGAEDDNGGTYAAEAERLGLDGLPYNQPLSDARLQQLLQGVHDAGKNRQIRTYPCVFSVRVWDQTPIDAKGRWQYAHDVIIEGLFGAYRVRDEPWRR